MKDKYIILFDTSFRELAKEANSKIEEGYTPCGGITESKNWFLQSMILEDIKHE